MGAGKSLNGREKNSGSEKSFFCARSLDFFPPPLTAPGSPRMDELHGNELVFAFSFVSSNNTDVETTEQFLLLHTRYLCDFSGLTNLSQKL